MTIQTGGLEIDLTNMSNTVPMLNAYAFGLTIFLAFNKNEIPFTDSHLSNNIACIMSFCLNRLHLCRNCAMHSLLDPLKYNDTETLKEIALSLDLRHVLTIL